MATDVVMPRLSDSMEEGTVLKWLVEEGAEVKRGEPLAEIETDKANMTYEADAEGTLIEVVAQEGDTVPIGEVIARLGEAGERPSSNGAGGEEKAGGEEAGGEEEAREEAAGEEAEQERREQPVATEEDGGPEAADGGGPERGEGAGDRGDGRVKASPVARRIAGEKGVRLETLEGSGPGGRIVKADVLAAAERGDGGAPEAEPAAAAEEEPAEEPRRPQPEGEAGPKGRVEVQELSRLQQTVSRRMAESKATAPDFALTIEIDMGACVELRARLKEIADPAPSYNDMVVKACAIALKEFPRANGAYRDGKFELYEKVNVGVAVAAKDTLIVPTIFDAGRKSLGEIARDARGVIEKVREGTITPPELGGGTFTVSNLGMYGIETFTAVINPPQAAILAVGALRRKPVVDEGGRIVARDMMNATLVADHRILYGADGAEFLARVRELLEQPLALAL